MKTATQLNDEHERIRLMAAPDQLSIIEAIIPYINHRQRVAIEYLGNPSSGKLELINHLNENIQRVLSII